MIRSLIPTLAVMLAPLPAVTLFVANLPQNRWHRRVAPPHRRALRGKRAGPLRNNSDQRTGHG